MLVVKENSIKSAWREAVKQLYLSESRENKEKKVFKDKVALIQVEDIENQEYYDDLFPMSKEEIDDINDYLVTGRNEHKIKHKWTKIYRKRLFEENNQIEFIINYLKDNPSGRRGQVSVWRNQEDICAEIPPCLQLLWFQIVEGKLEVHVHMRLGDCFGKLLMNINEFVAIQRYVAKQLGLKVGSYYHFVDSCHFILKDKMRIEEVVRVIG